MRRAGIVGLVVALAAPLVSVLPGTTAVAEAAATLPTMTADDLPTWQTDGIVWAVEYVNGVVYVGGTFSNVRPPGAAPGTQQVPRTNFAAFDAETGALLPCAPAFTHSSLTATIRAMDASPDGSRLYIGGAFSNVAGTGVANLVSLQTSTCTLTPFSTFRRPGVNATVRSVSASSTALYFGGDFTSVDSQTRSRYAMVSTAGVLGAAGPTLNLNVRAVLAAPEVGKIFIGGDFSTVNGSAVRGLVAVNPTTGAVVQTYPGWIPNNSVVKGLSKDETNFYVSAEGTGGGVFDGRIGGVLATGVMKWKDNCLGATQVAIPFQGVLYSGSHAHDCGSTPGGFPEGAPDGRQHLLAQSTETMEILPWMPDTNDGIGEALGPRAMVIAGDDQLWVAGEFTEVNKKPQQSLTRFALAPDTGYVDAPVLRATSTQAGKIKVMWLAGWDRDDDAVTYELFRNGTLVHTVTASSRQWLRPQLSFTDTVGPGVTAEYNIRTSEGTNVSPKGPRISATAATADIAYPTAVRADNPTLYWKLDETSGARVFDSSDSDHIGDYTGGVTLNLASTVAGGGRSITLNGSNGKAASAIVERAQAPTQYSVEMWFRTTTNRGGKLIGFGSAFTGNSGNYDRHVYMNNSGQLLFGAFDGSARTIKSQAAYRDGNWHHMVATQGSNGMRLYVDGTQVAQNTITGNQSYTGFWRVGQDNLNSWPERPTSNAFAGSIDEVAVYPGALSAARVLTHYAQGRPASVTDTQAPSTPTSLTASAVGDTVNLDWNSSIDNRGVAGYEVHRSATSGFTPSAATKISFVTGTEASDPGRPPGTWYYRVVALDVKYNASTPSAQASTSTQDAVAPGAPGTPSATIYEGRSVDLTWSAATDNVGVTGYQVHRGSTSTFTPGPATKVADVTGLTYTDNTIPAGTWHYRIVAIDGSNNVGAGSTATQVVAVPEAPSELDLNAADALAPAPTVTTTLGATTTIAGATLVAPNDPRFTYRGAGGMQFGAVFPDTQMYMPTSRYPNTWGSPSVYSVEFVTDAASFEIYTKYLNAAQAVRIKVDGQRVSDLPQPFGGTTLGSRHVYKVDFGSSQTRRITIETVYTPFGGIYLPAGASLTKAPPLANRWMVLGDSITAGSGVNTAFGLNSWILRAANYLYWDDPWNQAVGGTGYVADNSGASVPLGERVAADVAPYDPDQLVIWAGYNDVLEPQASIAAAASDLYAQLATAAPNADVYVVGVWSPTGTAGPTSIATDETLRAAAATAGLPFISPITGRIYDGDGDLVSSQRPWITDANAATYVGSDGRHPNDAGHAYIAQRMALAIERVADIDPPQSDETAPSAPAGVDATVTGADVALTWTASTDDVEVAGYDVHRSTDAGFTPSPATRIAQVTGAGATDAGLAVGTWYYRVVARDTSGNLSDPSAEAEAVVEPAAVTQSVAASADSYVHFFQKSTNFGTSQSITVGGDPEQTAYLRFPVPAAPAGQELVAATLRMRTTGNAGAGSVETQQVAVADNAWDETTVTWNTKPAITGPALGQLTGGSVPSTSYDIALNVGVVAGLLDGDASMAITAPGTDWIQVNSRQAASGRPELILRFE